MNAEQLKRALCYIAEGYYESCCADRYIIIANPDYGIDDGSDPYVVIDTGELVGIVDEFQGIKVR